jgi:hypothetical protein
MFSQLTARVRLGVWALPLAGVSFLAGLLRRGQPAEALSADFNPTRFAEAVSAPGYSIGWPLLIAGMVLLVFGYVSLYGYLATTRVERRALFAMLLSVAGATLQIGMFSIFAFVYAAIGRDYLAGQTDRVGLLSTLFDGSFPIYILAASLLYLAGMIAFAIAIGGAPNLPRWVGLLLPIYYLLVLAPAFRIGSLTTAYILELSGAALLIVIGGVLARAVGANREGTRPV